MAVIFLAVLVSWVFFRADNTGDAWHIITHMFTGWDRLPYLGSSAFETVLGFVLIMLLYAIQILAIPGSGIDIHGSHCGAPQPAMGRICAAACHDSNVRSLIGTVYLFPVLITEYAGTSD